LLFVLVIVAHDRRRIAHVAVTEHPTAAWTAQQLRNVFSENEAPRYLLHDRDRRHDEEVGGHDLAGMIGEECPPRLRRWTWVPSHVRGDGRLTDRDPGLQ
jgi:hypothetical protein